MMLHSRRLFLLLICCLMIFSLSQIAAQDETPTLTPVPTETLIPTLPPTETATDVPSATPLPSETPTALPSETPTPLPIPTASETATETPTVEISNSPAPTLTVDASLSPSPTPTITLTPSATASAAATSVFPTAQPLTQLFSNNFDTGDVSRWTLGPGWGLAASEGGQALQTATDAPLMLTEPVGEGAAEARVQFSTGTVQLTLRQGASGSYAVQLGADGQVKLLVTGQVVTTTNVAPNQAGQWRTLRLTAANNYLRVAVDGVEVLAALDASPLPAGTLTIVGIGAGTLLVDDVSVFTSSAIPTVSPTEPFTSTAAPELPILYTESFENPQLNQWFTDIRKSIVSINNGHALHVANPNAFFPLSQGNVLNVVFREDIKLNSGIAFLGVRHSGAGYYGVAFEANGTVSLYRTDQTLASVVTTPFIPGQWRTVQFSVIENTLRVAVDNIEVLNFTDSSFLPAGTMFVAGNVEIANDFLLDNMVIQGTIAPLQTQSPTINTVSLDQHQSSAQMLNMSIPDGTAQKIVFAKYVSTWGNPEIFIMSENGDNLLQLTDNTSSEYYPDLNKFGQIAFVSDLEGDYEIYTMNYNGTNPVRRTFTNGAESSPSWSPDGTSLIFERGSQIYTLNLSGGEQLIAFGTTYKYSPKWSPTDQRIIYTDSNGQGTDIYVMSSNGDNVNRLTYTGLAWDPNWSPDSSEIVFVQSPSQSSNYNGLVVIDSSNGGFKRQIVSNSILHIYSPSWSPDDSKIVFTAGYSIMLVSSQGGSLSPLTNGNNEFTPDFGLIPVPIPTATPTIIFATNTPAITTTPSALTPAQMAQLFLVPMIDNSNPVNPITLASPIEFADRASNPPKICSRDLNPLGEANNYPLVAPEAGEVVIIDDTWSDTTLPSGQRWATNYNAGLGRFIVTRIAVSQLDDAFVRTVNLNVAGTNSSSLNLQDGGWLYIAYAHLQSIDSTILSAFNNASNANYTYAVTKGQTIGISGNSNASINHLDLTVFYVPPLINGAPRPSQFGLDSGNSPAQGDLRKWYNVFYKIFLIVNNGVPVNVNVDPVILWPTLADNSGSTYQTIVTQSCQYLPVDVH